MCPGLDPKKYGNPIVGMFTDPLPSNGRLSIVTCEYVADVITETVPSNGSTRHNIIKITVI
jgi:hypothetical protein